MGVAKVLSQTVSILFLLAILAILFKSVIFSSGLVGDSIHINLVFFLISLLIFLFKSMYVIVIPEDFAFISLKSLKVPPYKSSKAII